MNKRICNQADESLKNNRTRNQRMLRTGLVVLLTLATMAAEIIYGMITGSMSLLADGIHMGTHTFALIITLTAYIISLKNEQNPRFAFSTGKVGILGGYTNAILLGITAFFMISEAVERIINPREIIFNQALIVAGIGLLVNIISAVLLSAGGDKHTHDHHGHDHSHTHKKDSKHSQDHNLRAAYIHVITDAMTSVLAIAALLTGKLLKLTWPDAAVAILGAAVILKWAFELLLSSGRHLVDYHPMEEERQVLMELAAKMDARIKDLHIWNLSEKDKAVILSISTGKDFPREDFIQMVKKNTSCRHITLEVLPS